MREVTVVTVVKVVIVVTVVTVVTVVKIVTKINFSQNNFFHIFFTKNNFTKIIKNSICDEIKKLKL